MLIIYNNTGDVLDDIGDLRRYLLLVEDEMLNRAAAEPGRNYVDQG